MLTPKVSPKKNPNVAPETVAEALTILRELREDGNPRIPLQTYVVQYKSSLRHSKGDNEWDENSRKLDMG